MSNPNKDEEVNAIDEYEEDGDEEEFDEDDEEEGQPEQQQSKYIDITKLPRKQRDLIEKNNKKLLFLKALAINCYQEIHKLALKVGIKRDSEAEGMIGAVIGLIGETANDADYPRKVLEELNGLVPDGYPNKISLDANDINELTNLFRVYEEKAIGAATLVHPDTIFGEGQIYDTNVIADAMVTAKSINPVSPNKKDNIVMMDATGQQSQNQQPFETANGQYSINQPNQPQQFRDIEYYAGLYNVPDIGLMEMALRKIPNPRPNSIQSFITSFSDLYQDWMQNPQKMMDQLRAFFGPTHGAHAFNLWRDYRDKWNKSQGGNPSITDYSYYGGGGGMGPMGGMQPMNMNYDMQADFMSQRMMDRRMQQLTNILQLRMMDKAMESQTPTSPMMMGQNYEEVLGPDGKVIKRVFLGGGNGGMNGQENPMQNMFFQGMQNLFTEVIRGLNTEKSALYSKLNTPDDTFKDLAKTMMANYVNNQNPMNSVQQMIEITNMLKSQNPQQDMQAKSLDAIKMDIDSKIALQELELKKMEMQHNWRMDEKQSVEQDHNVDKWLNIMLQMSEGFLKPVAMKFVEGMGTGANNPLSKFLGGMGGAQQQGPQQMQQGQGPTPEQQQQMAAIMQQNALLRQQQMQQQQQNPMMQPQYYPPQQPQPQRMPPITPLPPRNQQQNQMNMPLEQVSDQQIQNELSRLSPQQVQEMEDKISLQQMNQERIKHAIQAYKNAGNFSRPRAISPQQQEAQNVLNPQFEDDSDSEDYEIADDYADSEDDNEQLDESDFIPVASGKGPEPETPSSGQLSYKEFMPESTSEIAERKKMSDKQKAMYATGQMSERELRNLPDRDEYDDEEDDYSTDGVPMPAGIRNASDDAKVEENLKNTRQEPVKKTQSAPAQQKPKSAKRKKAEEIKDEITQAAEEILDDVEFIPSDDE